MQYSVINVFSQKMKTILEKRGIPSFLDLADSAKKRVPYQVRRVLTLEVIKDLLPEIPDLEVCREASGRPFLVSLQTKITLPHVSISHSGAWIGCVLSDQNAPMGIDIEDMTIQRSYLKIAQYAFSQTENTYVAQEGIIGFYRLWTAKEAIAKTLGRGLSDVLHMDLGLQLLNISLDDTCVIAVHETMYELTQKLIDDKIVCSFVRRLCE